MIKDPTGAIVGSVVGVLLFLTLVLMCIGGCWWCSVATGATCCCFRNRKAKKAKVEIVK